jgi:hypothetical protein
MKWEYHILTLKTVKDEDFQTLGEKRFELVGVNETWAFFKRPKPETFTEDERKMIDYFRGTVD